jgi:hypothetical protein
MKSYDLETAVPDDIVTHDPDCTWIRTFRSYGELIEAFEYELNNSMAPIEVCELILTPTQILKKFAPIEYDEYLDNWLEEHDYRPVDSDRKLYFRDTQYLDSCYGSVGYNEGYE